MGIVLTINLQDRSNEREPRRRWQPGTKWQEENEKGSRPQKFQGGDNLRGKGSDELLAGCFSGSRHHSAAALQELRVNNYNSDPMLRECGISIAPEFTQVEGRVLQAPQVGTLVEPYCSFHWMSLNAYYAGPLLLAPLD